MPDLALPAQPRRPRNSRYLEVLKTYNRLLRLFPMVALYMAVHLYLVFHSHGAAQFAAATFAAFINAIFASGPISYLRRQFDAPRAALTPGFRTPHIVVAIAVLIGISAIAPLIISLGVGLPFTPFFACTLLFTAGFAWLNYEPIGTSVVFFAFAIMLGTSNSITMSIAQLTARFSLLATVLALALLAPLIAIYSRLNGENASLPGTTQLTSVRLRRGNHDIYINFPFGPLTRAFATFLTFLQTRLAKFFERPHTPAPPLMHASFLARVQHRRRTTFPIISPALVALLIAVATAILALVIILSGGATKPADAAFLPFLFFLLPAFLWIALIGGSISWHRLYLPTEYLFPASRTRFIRELGLAFALDSLSFWTISSATAFLAIFLLPHLPTIQLATSIECCLLNAAAFLFSVGLFSWTTVFRGRGPHAVGALVTFALYYLSIATVADPTFSIPWLSFPTALASLTFAGLLLTAHAYHRWLRTDLA
ncbi:MAG: hypothetical protein ACTHN5_18800 [Phycisphaerae bacterium]